MLPTNRNFTTNFVYPMKKRLETLKESGETNKNVTTNFVCPINTFSRLMSFVVVFDTETKNEGTTYLQSSKESLSFRELFKRLGITNPDCFIFRTDTYGEHQIDEAVPNDLVNGEKITVNRVEIKNGGKNVVGTAEIQFR